MAPWQFWEGSSPFTQHSTGERNCLKWVSEGASQERIRGRAWGVPSVLQGWREPWKGGGMCQQTLGPPAQALCVDYCCPCVFCFGHDQEFHVLVSFSPTPFSQQQGSAQRTQMSPYQRTCSRKLATLPATELPWDSKGGGGASQRPGSIFCNHMSSRTALSNMVATSHT